MCAVDSLIYLSKLTKRYADTQICEDFGDFIYFGEGFIEVLPRIKFYGGTSDTRSTKNAPSYTVTRNGAGELVLEDWMTKKNCPNAFDSDYVSRIASFIDDHVAVLLLVWFCRLDEADALTYFEGTWSWDNLLNSIDCDSHLTDKLRSVRNEADLHTFCLANDLYTFYS